MTRMVFIEDLNAVASLAAVIAVAAAFGLTFLVGCLETLLLIKDFFVTAMMLSPGFEFEFCTLQSSASSVPNLDASLGYL